MPLGPDELVAVFSVTDPRTGDPLFTAQHVEELEHQMDQHRARENDRHPDKTP